MILGQFIATPFRHSDNSLQDRLKITFHLALHLLLKIMSYQPVFGDNLLNPFFPQYKKKKMMNY